MKAVLHWALDPQSRSFGGRMKPVIDDAGNPVELMPLNRADIRPLPEESLAPPTSPTGPVITVVRPVWRPIFSAAVVTFLAIFAGVNAVVMLYKLLKWIYPWIGEFGVGAAILLLACAGCAGFVYLRGPRVAIDDWRPSERLFDCLRARRCPGCGSSFDGAMNCTQFTVCNKCGAVWSEQGWASLLEIIDDPNPVDDPSLPRLITLDDAFGTDHWVLLPQPGEDYRPGFLKGRNRDSLFPRMCLLSHGVVATIIGVAIGRVDVGLLGLAVGVLGYVLLLILGRPPSRSETLRDTVRFAGPRLLGGRCPACDWPLRPERLHRLDARRCDRCDGAWFSDPALLTDYRSRIKAIERMPFEYPGSIPHLQQQGNA